CATLTGGAWFAYW
nr:immunoglobulin heavy chain junction region [Mus musculus]